jgi:hypothetical protein
VEVNAIRASWWAQYYDATTQVHETAGGFNQAVHKPASSTRYAARHE